MDDLLWEVKMSAYVINLFYLVGWGGGCHLYIVVLWSVRVLGISCPFFIQKLSLCGVWAATRLHCRIIGLIGGSIDRVIWSEALIFGSGRQRQSNLIPELQHKSALILPPMLYCGRRRLCAVFKWSVWEGVYEVQFTQQIKAEKVDPLDCYLSLGIEI